MDLPLSDIIDRITILRLKMERTQSQDVKNELMECEKAVKEFESRGIKLKHEWFEELSKHNKDFWDQVVALKEAEENNDLEEMGRMYIRQRIANKKRVEVKNIISKETQTGFKAYKG